MDSLVAQRWRNSRASYRPAGEPIRTSQYEVLEAAKKGGPVAEFVRSHHYSRTMTAARRQFGLYRGDQLVGAAVFGVPARAEALSAVPAPQEEVLDLGRFVLLDDVPANGETWFLGRCFELLLRAGFAGVVSFADPVRRTALDGRVVMPGHLGTIYRAHNAVYTGRSRARTHFLMGDGTIFSPRAVQKLVAKERGWRYAVEKLVAFGAPGPDGDLSEWAKTWLRRLSRPLRHGGNLRYAWGLHRAVKRSMPRGLKYPTWEELGVQLPLEV